MGSELSRVDLPVEHVSDTAWMVAEMRAMESDRPDAHFHDRLARKLVGTRGKEILSRFHLANQSEFLMSVRTQVIDEILLRLVGSGVQTVINLAAGLDTRPYRLPLPPSLVWMEVDFPAVVQYKNEILAGDPPVCQLERVAADLRLEDERANVFAKLGGESGKAVVLTEGLLNYLTEENVARLADELYQQLSFCWWILDAMDPGMMAWFKQMIGEKPAGAAVTPLCFIPRDLPAFLQPHGWQTSEFHSFLAEGRRLNRLPPGDWSEQVMASLDSSGIVVLSHK